MPVTNAQDMAKAGSLINSDGTTVSVAADLLIADKLVHTGDTNTAIRFPAADTVTVETSGTERMRIDSSGRVGIGTSSPSYPMDIVADSNAFALNLRGRSVDNLGYIRFSTNNGATNHAAVGTPAVNTLALDTNSTERLRIDSSGRVGIGTSSPATAYRMSLTGDGSTIVGGLSLTSAGITYIGAPSANSSAFEIWNAADNYVRIGTNNTERLRITSGGVVRIGTTTELLSSANILEVSGTNGIGIKATGGAANPCMLAWNSAASGNNTFAIFYTETSPSSVGSIDFNRASTLTRYNTTSDATLKNIIGDSSGEESVSILKNTRIRDYTWKKDATNKVNVGVIAQELYEVFKGAVSEGGDIVSKDSDGNDITTYRPWGVDKTAFTFHLVAGWQAHEKLIQELKSENDSLKTRIAALEAA